MNERIHAYGAKIFLQMTANAGRSTMPGMVKNYISPSAQPNRFDPSVQHREMAREEIRQYTADFVKGAMVAKRAGFGGVEIHAVHEGICWTSLQSRCITTGQTSMAEAWKTGSGLQLIL